LASKAHRVAKGLVGGCALLLGVGLSGCAAPQFTYIANSSANTYFKVPYGWHKISDSSLSNELKTATGGSGGGAWTVAYEAGHKPTAGDFLSFGTAHPFVFAEVGELNPTASNSLSYDALRDFFLPVTENARQSAAAQGFPLTGFKQIRDQTLRLSQGVHGVRETYNYTFTGGISDTFDEVALTNADQTVVYLLVLHCTTSCYSTDQTEINDVMSSFTIRSP
jgi:hypothetical protein